LRKRLAESGRVAGVGNRGHARFLDFPDGRVEIDEGKVAVAARWNGIGGVVAWGLADLDPRQVIDRYRGLWEIEACFRVNKSDPGYDRSSTGPTVGYAPISPYATWPSATSSICAIVSPCSERP